MDDVPGRVFLAGTAEGIFISIGISAPKLALFQIADVKLPELVRVVEARLEAFFLLVFVDMQEKLEDSRALSTSRRSKSLICW